MGKNLGKIIFLNAVGLTIFFSWYLPAEHGFWFTLDKSIFYYFNEQLQPESSFTYFVGLTNVRHFDIISLMAMLALYGYYYSKQDHLGKRKMWFIGVTMLVFKTKDYSGDSFPGDHGLMLMIYAGFMLRYFGKKAFAVSCIILIIFMLPRIMAGAHWFTDIVVGSLSISLVGLSWVLLTPVNDKCIDFLNKIFPDKAVK